MAHASERQAVRGTGGIRGRLVLRQAAEAERAPARGVGSGRGRAARPGRTAGGASSTWSRRRGPPSTSASRARASMDQRNERFVPHVLAVMVGTVVDFPNSDRTYHNVFSLSRAKRFDLGRYAAGKSKSVRMDRPGVVRVFCDIHSHMNAFVLVFAHPFFDVTDVDGRYELPNVPPGTYSVIGWYEGEPRITRSVTVTAGGWAELDLPVP